MAQTQRLSKSERNKLITLFPRLRRFAGILAGDRDAAGALLRAASRKMLDGECVSRRSLAFDMWAFVALQAEWLAGLRRHKHPISHSQGEAAMFLPAGASGEDRQLRDIAAVLAKLPPQQRSAVLLVYGEGFSYDEAARILDAPSNTVMARVSRALGVFIDGAGLGAPNVAHLQQIQRRAG